MRQTREISEERQTAKWRKKRGRRRSDGGPGPVLERRKKVWLMRSKTSGANRSKALMSRVENNSTYWPTNGPGGFQVLLTFSEWPPPETSGVVEWVRVLVGGSYWGKM